MKITVTNIPTYGTNAVSRFAIALLLELPSPGGIPTVMRVNGPAVRTGVVGILIELAGKQWVL